MFQHHLAESCTLWMDFVFCKSWIWREFHTLQHAMYEMRNSRKINAFANTEIIQSVQLSAKWGWRRKKVWYSLHFRCVKAQKCETLMNWVSKNIQSVKLLQSSKWARKCVRVAQKHWTQPQVCNCGHFHVAMWRNCATLTNLDIKRPIWT